MLHTMDQQKRICFIQCNKQYNFGQLCRCIHPFSLEEQCDRLNYIQDCISCNNVKKRVPCNSKTCKNRKRLPVSKSTLLNAGTLLILLSLYLMREMQLDINRKFSFRLDGFNERCTRTHCSFKCKILGKSNKSDQLNVRSFADKQEAAVLHC